ncbi:Armadillo repeat-containing protein LFR [Hibiscus syriacus]|uniref:Armadillo repeat-containing protein LFR n=1 Tax=Hibiscus syriacus TaxID=106335 RepID=A0A6A2ZTW3_HIBSY|nr:Armadillo repeat-containing protein LFR [Hibiscus syriacus]
MDDWRDIALPKELRKRHRARTLGANSVVTGFGNEYEALGSNTLLPQLGLGSGSSAAETYGQKNTTKRCRSEWWLDEDGLFNLDDEGRAEKQQCAVAASNIIRNFSFMPENEIAMAQHRHCLETVFQCIEDHIIEDEELVTNAIETIMYKRLVDILSLQAFDAQAAAVGALYNLVDVNMDCRLKLASERCARSLPESCNDNRAPCV